jgi:hypothetical protein
MIIEFNYIQYPLYIFTETKGASRLIVPFLAQNTNTDIAVGIVCLAKNLL